MPQDRTPPAEQWRAEPSNPDFPEAYWEVADDRGYVIARGLTEEQARLIAAAPANQKLCEELADALEAMRTAHSADIETYTSEFDFAHKAWDMMEAALKAAGRAPG